MMDPKKELLLTREFDAPRELVWKAWTDPKLLSQWWGPNGVTNPVCELDARVGGNIHIVMLAGEALGPMNGQRWPMHGTIKELVVPEKLVYTSTALEEPDGTPNMENIVTVTFDEHEGKTILTVHVLVTHATDKAGPALGGMSMGWNQQLDKLVSMYKTFV